MVCEEGFPRPAAWMVEAWAPVAGRGMGINKG